MVSSIRRRRSSEDKVEESQWGLSDGDGGEGSADAAGLVQLKRKRKNLKLDAFGIWDTVK